MGSESGQEELTYDEAEIQSTNAAANETFSDSSYQFVPPVLRSNSIGDETIESNRFYSSPMRNYGTNPDEPESTQADAPIGSAIPADEFSASYQNYSPKVSIYLERVYIYKTNVFFILLLTDVFLLFHC